MTTIKAAKIIAKRMEQRAQLWPKVPDEQVWNRKRSDGFSSIPRSMPLMMEIMDDLTNGKPTSRAYLALWCRVWDEGFVVVNSQRELALESGFDGQRAERTWLERMRTLRDMGFILAQPGATGEFNFVSLLNPYQVIARIKKKGTAGFSQKKYTALVNRAIEIGAKDISNIKD